MLKEEDSLIDLEKFKPDNVIVDQVLMAIDNIMEQDNQENLDKDGNLKLRPIFEYLDQKISYDDIRFVIGLVQ